MYETQFNKANTPIIMGSKGKVFNNNSMVNNNGNNNGNGRFEDLLKRNQNNPVGANIKPDIKTNDLVITRSKSKNEQNNLIGVNNNNINNPP